MRQYTVRPGYTFGNRGQYQPGDVVEMAEAEAAGFLDKLELVQMIEEGPMFGVEGQMATLKDSILSKLVDAGFLMDGMILSATDEELLAIDGIGEAALGTIREVVGAYATQIDSGADTDVAGESETETNEVDPDADRGEVDQ